MQNLIKNSKHEELYVSKTLYYVNTSYLTTITTLSKLDCTKKFIIIKKGVKYISCMFFERVKIQVYRQNYFNEVVHSF